MPFYVVSEHKRTAEGSSTFFIFGKEVAAMLLKKLKSRQGISLPLAMAITAVLIILSASLIAIAASSIMNTSSSVNNRQAYLNVRSAIEYAYAYYSDSNSVPDLTKIENEYMVMNDKEGGTTSEGAQIVSEADVEEYTTYVVANYIPPSTGRDSAAVKLKAFSKSTDAFGKKSQSVTLTGVFTVNKLANKNRVTLTDIDMDTEVLNYNTTRDAITLHVKQYPGQNWTPFYYLWTYKDQAEMYAMTSNCYGLEAVYKSKVNDSNSGLIYYKLNGQKNDLAQGFNQNEYDASNLLEPASVWNALPDSNDPRNGTSSYFTPTGNGWYDATYYIVNNCGQYSNGTTMKQVNYFNLIITAKGKVLNNTRTGKLETEGVQTNEMFHLWYLNNSDRNIYFEFLKPGMVYTPGSSWNGIQELDDRMLVYVKNQKTTVHFKVKGIGDDKEEAVKCKIGENDMITPVINDIRIGGVNIFQTDHTYDNFSNSMSSNYYGAGTLEKAWRDANLGSGGKGDMKNFFYGIDTAGQSRMMYEGCGWWVANIETSGTFSMTVTYGDRNGASHTSSVNVTPNSDNEAYVVVDLDRPAILSRLTESRANELIGVDDNSYTTIHVKSSEIGSPISPFIDYKENEVSSAEKRLLLEAVEKAQTYVRDDYEDASYNALDALINQGISLYNDTDYINNKGLAQANKDYSDLTKKILDAIAALRTKTCSAEVYRLFEQAVEEGVKIEEAQEKSKKYDGAAFASFNNESGIYQRCKTLRAAGNILNNTGSEAYTTSMVYLLIDELNTSLNTIRENVLDKTQLEKLIKSGKTYVNNSRYEESYRIVLNDVIVEAENVVKESVSQNEINECLSLLTTSINDVKTHMAVSLDTAALTDLITRANEVLGQTKENCTDESYNALKAATQAAQSVFDNALANQNDVDNAYEVLLEAFNNFEIIKPSEKISVNAITTDKLTSQNKIRIWVKGLNKGEKIKGYYDGNNNFVNFEYEVVSFTLEEYIGNSPRGLNLNSDGAHSIEGQNLTYFDIDVTQANGFMTTVVLKHYVRDYNDFDPSTGTYKVTDIITESYSTDKMISSADVSDGNFVINFESLKKVASTSANGKEQEINTLNLNKGKLTEYYIKGIDETSVQVYKDGAADIYPAVVEGDYKVVRFVTDADQTAVIKTANHEGNEYYYSYPIEVSSGQYVVTLTDTNQADANILRVVAPYDVKDLPGDSLSAVNAQVIVNGKTSTYSMIFDGQNYVIELPFKGQTQVKIIRYYYAGNDTSTLRNSQTGNMIFSSPGEYNIEYTTINNTRISSGLSKFVNKTADLLLCSRIYPRYSSSSGSAVSLDGIVADSIVSSILKLPAVSESAPTPFDYFGQSGVDSVPTQNLGTTIIWIDTDNSYFRNKDLSKLYVYAWDYNCQSLTGNWPGRPALRVAETHYYYLPVNSNALGCVLSFKYSDTDIQKIGSNDNLSNYGGNIYFDRTDYQVWTNNKTILSEPGICKIGQQGKCSLFEKIDQSVLDGSSFTWGGKSNRFDGYVYRAPGKKTTGSRMNYNINNSYTYYNKTGEITGQKKMEVYSYGKYYYRAITSNEPPMYEYEEPVVDTSDMTAADLRMAFVGGNKIRMKNASYYYTYGELYTKHSSSVNSNRLNSSHSINIAYNNLFGGAGGNGGSMGRIGDTDLTMVYDWYEYKIPVDKTNTFTFQVKGLKYNPSYVNPRGKKWYDKDYRTDNQYTEQIKGVYGDVWMVMNNTTKVENGKFVDMVLYSSSPEDIQVNDQQDIYFRLPSGWSSNDVKVTASGVGEDKEYTFSSYNGLLKTTIPSKTPFLVFEAKDASGRTFTCRTSLQGNDLILFDPTFRAGTGGWDNYIDPRVQVERELYAAHSIYYGSVLPKDYDSNGNAVKQSNGSSYDYAEGIKKHVLNGNFNDQYVNDNGRNQSYATVHSYVTAYSGLYAMMAKARSYISGHNYPEFLHNGKPNIYDATTINELEAELGRAKSTYINEDSSVSQILSATASLENKINNVTVSTSQLIPLIFYDTQNLVGSGATFEIQYSTDAAGNNPVKKKIEYFNTEHCPIIFISATEIYNVKFIVNGTDEGVEKDHITLIEGAWVYMDIAKKAGVTTSYWVQNAASDYRQITNTTFTQTTATDTCNFDMTVERKSINDVVSPAQSLEDAKQRNYRPITFYFKHDVTVKLHDGTSYKIRAGAYSFNDKLVGTDSCPIEYVNDTSSGSNNWVPRMNLYTNRAKDYFENPSSYWKYSDEEKAVDAESLTGWVTRNGDALEITAGGHNTTKTVNMTVNSRSFAATRVWNYLTTGKMYFRWEGNQSLRVDNNVSFTAQEIVFASSGTVDATSNYNKHIYFQTKDRGQNSMEVVFPTDIHVEYIDKYREQHSFTIREGSYTVEKADPNQSFICDLCDEDYWESMVHVTINNRYDSLGGFDGSSNKNTRFGSVVYSND